ncbi:MAG: hypothetical protein AAGF45_04370 [Pseudomonadota bacterium]
MGRFAFRRVVLLPIALVLAACQTAFPIQLRSDLTRAEVLPYGEKGERIVAGQAFLRQVGGGLVTCAGETVTLVPAVKLVDEAMKVWRAKDEIYTVNLPYARVRGAVRYVECDASGGFVFEELPALSYWVFVNVRWRAPKAGYLDDGEEGGLLVERISVRHEDKLRVIVDSEDKLAGAKPWELTPHLTKSCKCAKDLI